MLKANAALVASGKFWFWSVTWEDVQAAMDRKLAMYLMQNGHVESLHGRLREE